MTTNSHVHENEQPNAPPTFRIRRDVRIRFLVVFIWLISVGIMQSKLMLVLSSAAAVAAARALGIPLRRILRRIKLMAPFLFMSFLTLSLSEGFPITSSALAFATMIALRIAASLFALTLVSVDDIKIYLSGFKAMGFPDALTSTLFLTQRYVHLIFQQMASVKNALVSRLFSPRARMSTMRVYGQIIGGTMVKAIDRSESIQHAMESRGFDGKVWTQKVPPVCSRDIVLAAVCLLVAIGFVFIDRRWCL